MRFNHVVVPLRRADAEGGEPCAANHVDHAAVGRIDEHDVGPKRHERLDVEARALNEARVRLEHFRIELAEKAVLRGGVARRMHADDAGAVVEVDGNGGSERQDVRDDDALDLFRHLHLVAVVVDDDARAGAAALLLCRRNRRHQAQNSPPAHRRELRDALHLLLLLEEMIIFLV